MHRYLAAIVLALLLSGSFHPGAGAQHSPDTSDLEKLVLEAAETLMQMRKDPQHQALDELLHRCRGIMIFPAVTKAGLIGGMYSGQGVLCGRTEDGTWSYPAFYKMTGISAGLLAGFCKSRIILVLMDDRALTATLRNSLELGGEGTWATGDELERGEHTLGTLKKSVFVFASGEGWYFGLSLEGALITAREGANRRFYGPEADAAQIVVDMEFKNATALPLIFALQ